MDAAGRGWRGLVVAAAAVALLALAGPAGAQSNDYVGVTPPPPTPTPQVLPTATPAPTPTVAVLGTKVSENTLPFTGGDIAGMTALALAAVGAGAVMIRAGRRRPDAS